MTRIRRGAPEPRVDRDELRRRCEAAAAEHDPAVLYTALADAAVEASDMLEKMAEAYREIGKTAFRPSWPPVSQAMAKRVQEAVDAESRALDPVPASTSRGLFQIMDPLPNPAREEVISRTQRVGLHTEE